MHVKRINMHLKHTKIYKYASKPPKNVHIPPVLGWRAVPTRMPRVQDLSYM